MVAGWNAPTEDRVIANIFRYLERLQKKGYKIFAWKNHGGRFAKKGMPDIMVLTYNEEFGVKRFLALEAKRAGTAIMAHKLEGLEGVELWKAQGATEIQAEILLQLQEAGAECYVVESTEQIKKILGVE